MSSKSAEIYLKTLDFVGKRGPMLGLNCLAPGYKFFNLKIFLVLFDAITYTLVTFYCLNEFAGDLERVVFCLVTYGFGIQGFSKLQTFWIGRKSVMELTDKIFDFYRSTLNEKSAKLFEKYAKISFIACKFCNFLYIIVGVITLINPIAVKLLTGKLVLPYGFKLPMIDEYSFFGYTINLIHHLIQDYVVVFGFIFSDGIYIIAVIHIYCLYDNLMFNLDELNETINEKKFLMTKVIRRKLILIVQLHQELLSYIRFIEKFFKRNVLICIFSNVSQIVCCLFALVVSKWYIGAFLLIALLSIQILVLCIFGTFLVVKNENLQKKIYDINWYNLELRDQKTLQIILLRANYDVYLTYIMGVLNFESFVSIYQKVYSFFMMLISVY